MLRQSLKELLIADNLQLDDEKWGSKRPEELKPHQFIDLVVDLYGVDRGGVRPEGSDVKKVWRLDKANNN
jgi:hypothetical protein